LSGKPNTCSTSITPDGNINVKQATKSHVASDKVTEKASASYRKKTQSGATSSWSDKTGTKAISPIGTTKPPATSKVAKPPSQQIRNNTRQDHMEDLVFPINLLEMAKNAWKECYGTDLPHTIPIGDSYKKIGTVWTQSISEPHKPSVYTTTEYPPSVLDESFKSQKCAKDALHWWIICTFLSATSILSWANELIGNRDYVVLVVSNYLQAWCKLLRDSKGSIWVKSKGRKCAIS
jgi:hypothetical protein